MIETIYLRRKLGLLIFALFIFSNKNIAQNCEHSQAVTSLEGNNIRASIPANGNLFYTLESDNQFQQITPTNLPTPSTIFAAGIWVGALNDANELKLAAATYSSPTRYDFVTGPILNDNGQLSFDCENYDRLWEVKGTEINAHLADFSDNGTVDNPLENIYGYPAHQNPHFENIHGFSLPNTPQGLAPFHDENSDGIYNPDDGDFPLPESVSPDRIPTHIVWGVFNDGGTQHFNTGGDALNIEIQQTAWSFYCDDNELLSNSIFTSHKIINRGVETLDSLIVSKWIDFDLGCYTDDHMGCIPDLNTFYSYNEDPIDGSMGGDCVQGVPSFDDNPPVQAVTFLNQNMSSFAVATNGSFGVPNPGVIDPTQPAEFYNYMQGLWRDGMPFTVGGSGYGGTEVTSFMYPDNPNDSNGWSMHTGNLPFGDRRGMGSTTINGAFPPGGVVTLDMAYTFYQDENLDHVETVDLVYDNTPMLQQMYNDGFATNCSYVACMDDCVWTGDADKDSVVTTFDILQIGLGYGKFGFVRSKPLTWQPFEGDDWTVSLNGLNLKHTDCDGNATIDENDFYYVNQNFDNSYKSAPIVDDYPIGPELGVLSNGSANLNIDTLTPNEIGIAEIFLFETEDLYGLAMTVEVDTQFLRIVNSVSQFAPWANTSDDFSFGKDQTELGEYHYAFTKTDGNNSMSEQGKIMQLYIKAQTTDFMLVESQIRLKNIKAVLNDGTELDYGAQNFTVQLFNSDGDGVILNNENLEPENIVIFPNPTSDVINITSEKMPTYISIFDIYGKSVLEKRSGFENEMQLSIDHFSAGVYFVKIKMGEQDFVKKVVKF